MLRTRPFIMASGERYLTLLDIETQIPHYASNLFIITQVRNSSLSYSSITAAAAHLVLLYRFLGLRHIDFVERCRSEKFLHLYELDALKDFCGLKFKQWNRCIKYTGMLTLEELLESDGYVDKNTHYCRLTTIANYLVWFGRQYFDHLKPEPKELGQMGEQIKARRPKHKGRNTECSDTALTQQEMDTLLEIIHLESPNNPFIPSVRSRNRLMVLLEKELGIRGGELLNLRIADFDFSTNTVLIARRADQPDDPRLRQPLVKTLDRTLPLSDDLAADVHSYILGARRLVSNARRCPYLFVSHKNGPTVGHPLSIAGYQKVWLTIRNVFLTLAKVRGHRLRHSWNQTFSEYMDNLKVPVSEAKQELIRSRSMGWKEGSGTASRYNKRFIAAKADEAGLALQRKARTKGEQ